MWQEQAPFGKLRAGLPNVNGYCTWVGSPYGLRAFQMMVAGTMRWRWGE